MSDSTAAERQPSDDAPGRHRGPASAEAPDSPPPPPPGRHRKIPEA